MSTANCVYINPGNSGVNNGLQSRMQKLPSSALKFLSQLSSSVVRTYVEDSGKGASLASITVLLVLMLCVFIQVSFRTPSFYDSPASADEHRVQSSFARLLFLPTLYRDTHRFCFLQVWELTANNVIMVSAIGNDGPLYGYVFNIQKCLCLMTKQFNLILLYILYT